MRTWTRAAAIWVICGLASSCSSSDEADTSLGADTWLPDIEEVTGLGAIQPNGYGGIVPLTIDEAPVIPGEACGECGGIVTCVDSQSATCTGAQPANACGGCAPLPATVGASCGACGGEWACNESGGIECSASTTTNVCGGCADLSGASPGVACDAEGLPGVTRCVTLDAIECVALSANGCGGTAELEAVPGTFCGACDRGVWVCEGPDVLACQNSDNGLNACGGCTPLAGTLGASCPGCDGVWACEDGGSVSCTGTPYNACGGCAALDGAPGEACDGGTWACQGADALSCEADANLCGGTTVLSVAPGQPCGPCEDGVTVCATTDSTACVGASDLNACGGCGVLPGAEGDACAPNGVWQCHDAAMVCVLDPEANPCGGSAALDVAPGTACGTCDAGVMVCNGFDGVVCAGGGEASFYAWPDVDGDEYGDATAQPEVQCELADGFVRNDDDCDDSEDTGAAVHPDATEVCDGLDNDCDEVVDPPSALGAGTFYADSDGDGFGTDTTVQACELPAGYATQSGDCDDGRADVFPAAEGETCTENVDVNCDGTTLYVDADEDGVPSCGGTLDCDDGNPAIHRGLPRCATRSTTTAMG